MKPEEYYQCQRPEIANLVPEDAIRILDVGCGAGGLGRTLLRANPSREIHGIELVESAAEKAREAYKYVHVGELEKVDLPYEDAFFDVIIFADVLEHLVDPWGAIGQLGKYLSDSGVIISSIPNIAHWSILRGLLKGEWNYVQEGILDKTHLRFFTNKSIQVMYRNLGYTIVHIGGTTTGGNPLKTPELNAGLQSIDINPDKSLSESDVFQYLTVSKKMDLLTSASIILIADENIDLTRQSLDALVQQYGAGSLEIIVVADATANESYYRSLTSVQVVSVSSGASYSEKVNAGAEKAKGELLCFLKGDFMVSNRSIERLFECLCSSNDIAMVGPLSTNVEGEQNLSEIRLKSEMDLNNFSEKVFYQLVNNWVTTDKLSSCCIAMRKSHYSEVGGFSNVLKNERTAVASLSNKLKESGGKLVIAQDTFIYHLPFAE